MRLVSKQVAMVGVLSFAAALASAQNNLSVVTIKVVDKRKSPVASSLFLNPGMLPIGKTSATGEYRFKHKCELGQTFKAQPEDRGLFYDSEDQVCGQRVELEVFPRPVATFKIEEAELFTPGKWQAVSSDKNVYAGVFGGVADKVEQLPGRGDGRCRVTLDKQYVIGVYSPSTGTWKKLEHVNTTFVGASDDSVYVFQSSCADAQPQILELKKRAQVEVKDATMSLSASQKVGADVQKALRGVKF